MRRSRKCLGLIALMVICGDLLGDRVEAGGRNRRWNHRSYSCVTPSPTCCAAQPTACQTTSPCNSSSNGCGVGSINCHNPIFANPRREASRLSLAASTTTLGRNTQASPRMAAHQAHQPHPLSNHRSVRVLAPCTYTWWVQCERAFTATGQKRFEKQLSHPSRSAALMRRSSAELRAESTAKVERDG